MDLLVSIDSTRIRRPVHCFGNRLGIDEIALVGLHERLYILCRNQPHFMALPAKSLAQKMRARASFPSGELARSR